MKNWQIRTFTSRADQIIGAASTTGSTTTKSHGHFILLDSLRGVAAMAVVLLHSYKEQPIVPNGQLAVDLFFILSGFVIAFAYDDGILGPGAGRRFLIARFVRLYPMLFVGAAGGLAVALLHNRLNPAEAYPTGSMLVSGLLSLAVLPYLGKGHLGDLGAIFSFNPVLWSLFFELAANLVYVAFARHLTNRVLAVIVVAGLVGITWAGPLGGGSQALFLSGFPRVACGFFGGILLFRLWRAGRLPAIRGNFVVMSLLLLALFAIPELIGGIAFVPAFVLMCGVVLAAANARPPRRPEFHKVLGRISYPVYTIHWLTLYVFAFVGKRFGLVDDLYVVVAVAHLCAAPFIAWGVERYYEAPARRWLKDRLLPRAPVAEPASDQPRMSRYSAR